MHVHNVKINLLCQQFKGKFELAEEVCRISCLQVKTQVRVLPLGFYICLQEKTVSLSHMAGAHESRKRESRIKVYY